MGDKNNRRLHRHHRSCFFSKGAPRTVLSSSLGIRTNVGTFQSPQPNRHIRARLVVISSPQFLLPGCRMPCLSLVALMLLHFNRRAPLSPPFMQFCWLHYLFSTSPLFANVLMSEFKLFAHCCGAVPLNECASPTIHHIMHIWSSQFKDNSSCHSHACLREKDTFHRPCQSQSAIGDRRSSWQKRIWSKSPLKQEHTLSCLFFSQAFFLNLQEKERKKSFFSRLHNRLPRHCHIFSLCSRGSFWHAVGNFHIFLYCFSWMPAKLNEIEAH